MSAGPTLYCLALIIPLAGTHPAVGTIQYDAESLTYGLEPAAQTPDDVETLLARESAEGEAHIWYLGHCGWAIKTRTRLLIFDYWEQDAIEGVMSLATGRIIPAEIQGLDVYVFVSHAHGDHYDPVILSWEQTIPKLTYIFGRGEDLDSSFVYMSEERAERTFGDMQVLTVNHSFDRIPEVAFLIRVDGLVIYHSGDHASTTETPNRTFTGNIDYFAGEQDHVDLAFVSTFGSKGGAVVNNGDLHTIEKLRPRWVFPMHHGDNEDLNQSFADEVAGRFDYARIVAARRLGDHFHYSVN